MFYKYEIFAEVVYVTKLTNKYILLKYNCTGMFFLVAVVLLLSRCYARRRLSAHIRLEFVE